MDASTAESLTAFGTVIAAVGTVGALAFAASAAKSASRSAKIASQALEAEARPLLLDVPYEHYTDYEHEYPWPGESIRKTPMRGLIAVDATYGAFVFAVRNVGRGAAIVERVSLTVDGVAEPHHEFSGKAIPAGDEGWLSGHPPSGSAIRAALGRSPSPVHGPMPYILTATYTDLAGAEATPRTRRGNRGLRQRAARDPSAASQSCVGGWRSSGRNSSSGFSETAFQRSSSVKPKVSLTTLSNSP